MSCHGCRNEKTNELLGASPFIRSMCCSFLSLYLSLFLSFSWALVYLSSQNQPCTDYAFLMGVFLKLFFIQRCTNKQFFLCPRFLRFRSSKHNKHQPALNRFITIRPICCFKFSSFVFACINVTCISVLFPASNQRLASGEDVMSEQNVPAVEHSVIPETYTFCSGCTYSSLQG